MSEKQKKNEININGKPVQVTSKRLTFFDVQAIAPLFANGDMNFSNYWRYAFSNWLHYEPSIDIEDLNPEEGQQLASLLPQPTQNSSSTDGLLISDFATNNKGWNTF